MMTSRQATFALSVWESNPEWMPSDPPLAAYEAIRDGRATEADYEASQAYIDRCEAIRAEAESEIENA